MEGQPSVVPAPVTVEPAVTGITPKPVENEAPKESRKIKVKVDGEYIEVDEADLISDYGKGKAADKKFQEAAALRKEAVSFIEALKKDPLSVLTNPKLGLNLREIAETHLMSILEDEVMDPKDKELRDLRKDKQTREEEAATAKKEVEAEELAKLSGEYMDQYEKSFQTCLEASGLPKTQHTVKRIAFYMHEGMKRNLDLKPEDVVVFVKEEYLEEQKSLFSSLDGENLLKFLGEDLAKKIRKYDTGRVISPKTISRFDQPNVSEKGAVKKEPGISRDEWKAKMDRIKAGLE